MDTELLVKFVCYILGAALGMICVNGCRDPPRLYQRFPNPAHRYFSHHKPETIETVGGVPVVTGHYKNNDNNNNIAAILFGLNRRTLSKRNSADGCGPQAGTWQSADVEDRALCNWRYVPKYNHSRYPNIVLEAETPCHECSSFFYDQKLSLGKCEPVYRSFPVLERTGCEGGIYKYETTHVNVKVAFVCTRPRSAPALEINENGVDLNFLDKR